MTKLNGSQRALLAAANAEGVIDTDDGAKSATKALIKQGLAISLPEGGGISRLIVTQAGRAALGVTNEVAPVAITNDDEGAADTPQRAIEPGPAHAEAPAPGGKIATLVALLERPEGASVEAMTAATGWQAHSVRGAMSGAIKKKLGLTILSEKSEGRRIYRIPASAEAGE